MNENGLANKLFNENRTEKLEKKFRKKIQKVKTDKYVTRYVSIK